MNRNLVAVGVRASPGGQSPMLRQEQLSEVVGLYGLGHYGDGPWIV
jgi:hypothetical protein